MKTSEQIRAKFKFAYRIAIVTNIYYAFNLKKIAELDWPDHKVYVTTYNDSYEVLVVK